MRISASQLELAELCPRKWWLKYKGRMPELPKGSTSFGNVLHAACERYLLGASLHDLWPQGWDVCPDSKQPLDPTDAALVMVLIEEAVKQGILERRPGGRVEHKIDPPLACLGHQVIGKIDYLCPGRVEDHKNSKSERYFKSAEGLKKNIQMMLYAAYELERGFRMKGAVPPKFISLVHNQYLRDHNNPKVRRREAEVTPAEIDDYWASKIVPLVKLLEELDKINSPFLIPLPDKSACEAFGGCDFQSICHAGEDMLTFKKRITTFLESQQGKKPTTHMTEPQDFLARRLKGASPAAAVNPPMPAAVAVSTPPPPAADIQPPPPWFDPNCPVCSKSKNKGIGSSGRACQVCLFKAGKNAADGYRFEPQSDGRVLWIAPGGAVGGSSQVVNPAVASNTKTAYGMAELLPRLQAMASVEGVVSLIEEAEKLLGAGTADFSAFTTAAEKRLEILANAAAASTPTPVAAPATPVQTHSVAAEPRPAAVAVPATPATVITDPTPTTISPLPTAPAAPAPAKRGRPKGSKNKPAGEAQDAGEAPRGFILLIRAGLLASTDREVVSAEQILQNHPNYWQSDVWARRGEIRQAFANETVRAALDGAIVMASVGDPDVDNLVSTLMPYAELVVRGSV